LIRNVAPKESQFTQASPLATFKPMMADLIAVVIGGRLIVGSSMVLKIASFASPFIHSQTRREKLESQNINVINSAALVKRVRSMLIKGGGEDKLAAPVDVPLRKPARHDEKLLGILAFENGKRINGRASQLTRMKNNRVQTKLRKVKAG
jgi:hypothetical protein